MQIRFKFDLDKALHAMTYLVDRLGAVDKVKLMKLMYIADRNHFLQYGYPITGDRQCAMKYGPVPSGCLDALNGQILPDPTAAFKFLHVDDAKVMLKAKPESEWLTEEEIQSLNEVLRFHGDAGTWELRDKSHDFPEYKAVYREGTSTLIPYELILKLHKPDAGYSYGRLTLPEAALHRLAFPFTAKSDADL